MAIFGWAVLIGVVAGMRTMTAPTAVSFAAHAGWLSLGGTWLAFFGYRLTPWVLLVLALGELIVDLLPRTPSRKVPAQFVARLVSGAVCGAAVATATGEGTQGLAAGVLGALLGTFGGAALREKLASALKQDGPAAVLEDALAVGAALLVISTLS